MEISEIEKSVNESLNRGASGVSLIKVGKKDESIIKISDYFKSLGYDCINTTRKINSYVKGTDDNIYHKLIITTD